MASASLADLLQKQEAGTLKKQEAKTLKSMLTRDLEFEKLKAEIQETKEPTEENNPFETLFDIFEQELQKPTGTETSTTFVEAPAVAAKPTNYVLFIVIAIIAFFLLRRRGK